jgi:hypothetical protein
LASKKTGFVFRKSAIAASLLDNLSRDPVLKNAVAFLVAVNVSDKVERFNITARKGCK